MNSRDECNLYSTLTDNADIDDDIGNQIINNLFSTPDVGEICKYYDVDHFNSDITHASSNL